MEKNSRAGEKTCSKHFPKSFRDSTSIGENSYVGYRRRHGFKAEKHIRGVGKVEMGNEYVVPYNPYLCYKFNCHLNVELTTGINAVKYLYKYIFKGNDRATISLLDEDGIHEGKQYIDSRILTSTEAA